MLADTAWREMCAFVGCTPPAFVSELEKFLLAPPPKQHAAVTAKKKKPTQMSNTNTHARVAMFMFMSSLTPFTAERPHTHNTLLLLPCPFLSLLFVPPTADAVALPLLVAI